MKRALLPLIALAAAAPAVAHLGHADTAPSDDAYPIVAVVSGVQSACGNLVSWQQTTEALSTAGFTPVELSEDALLAQVVDRNDGFDLPLENRKTAYFTGNLGGESVRIEAVEGTHSSGKRYAYCRLHDIGETREFSTSSLSAFKGRPADNVDAPKNSASTWRDENGGISTGLAARLFPAVTEDTQQSPSVLRVDITRFGDAEIATVDNSYPALEVLNAFREGCGSVENQAATAASLTAADWQEGTAFIPTQLVMFLTFAQETGGAAVTEAGGTMSDMQVFKKTIAGEELYVVLSEVEADGTRVSACRLFDMGETRPIPPETVAEWLDREPTKIIDQAGVQITDWEPGTQAAHDSFQVFFIPPDSQLADIFKFDGVALKSDTVGVVE